MNTVLYFTADWCNPCQRTKPFAEELVRDGANIKFIDVDSEIEMVKTFKILSVPTYIILKNEQEVHRANGAKTKEQLRDLLNYEQQ
jgi:thioredoxin 1